VDDGQAESESAVVLGAARILLAEAFEDARQEGSRDPPSMVAHGQTKGVADTARVDFNDVPLGGELNGIAQEIPNDLLQPGRIGLHRKACSVEGRSDLDLSRRRRRLPPRGGRGVERGEVRPDAVNSLVADVLPAVLMHRVILQRERITERDITEIIEQILIPLVEVR